MLSTHRPLTLTITRIGLVGLTLFASVVLPVTSLNAADSWTRFRGPNGGGQADAADIPVSWSDKEILWKTALPSKGHSSPVVWDNRVFVTCAEKESGKRFVVGIDAQSGAIVWTHESAGSSFRQHADNSFASASPAVDAKHVYVVWFGPDGSIMQAFTHDGKIAWSFDLGAFTAQHGAGASPIVVGDQVILPFEHDGPGNSYVIAIDATTGKERWRTPRTSGKMSAATPCLLNPSATSPMLGLTSTLHGIYAIDVTSGKVMWEQADIFKQRCVGSPIMAGGLFIAGDGQGGKGVSIIATKPPDKVGGKPSEVWRLLTGIPYVPCLLPVGKHIFFVTDGGVAVCIDAATGKDVWRETLGVGAFYGSPVLVGERIFIISKRGEVAVFAAADKFKPLGVSQLGEGSFASPAVAGGRMYLRTFSSLIAVGKK